MPVAIPRPAILRRLGLRGQAHGATPTVAGRAPALDHDAAVLAGLPPSANRRDLRAVHPRVAVKAEGQAVGYLVTQRRRRVPGDRVVGMQLLGRPALPARVAISGEHGPPPLLVAVATPEIAGRGRLIGTRGEVPALLSTKLHRMPTSLLERRTAPLARQCRCSVRDCGAWRRACRVAVAYSSDERLAAAFADDGSAWLAVGVTGRRDLEVAAATATGSDQRVGLHHKDYTTYSGALERLSGMGLTPRLADG